MIYENLFGSIVNFTQDVIALQKNKYSDVAIEYIDWEAHANIHELPDNDLIGTTSITFTEEEPNLFTGSFTVGVSSFKSDKNLFRLRNHVGEVFRRLRPSSKVAYYDRESMAQLGWLYIVDGTIVMPMTKADVRPLQFVQCHFVFDAMTAVG